MNKCLLHILIVSILIFSTCFNLHAEEEQPSGENASNPLAKVRNTDLRYQYFDLEGGADRTIASVEGAFMAQDKLKIIYELHYWETDVTGSTEKDWESFSLRNIYFPAHGEWGSWKYRVAVGVEWILDFDNNDKGIGSGSDQLAPLIGVALSPRPGTTLVPLIQQFWSYSGNDVNTTGPRIIAIQTLPKDYWLRLDGRFPIDWENDNEIPASLEVQLGKHLSKTTALYVDGLFGLGGDRPYDNGVGLALRFKY